MNKAKDAKTGRGIFWFTVTSIVFILFTIITLYNGWPF